jgi:hypothetical protein
LHPASVTPLPIDNPARRYALYCICGLCASR